MSHLSRIIGMIRTQKDKMMQCLSGHMRKLKFDRQGTESFMFYLHYRVTFLMLMACCTVVTLHLFAGDPMICQPTHDMSKDVIESYCWLRSPYSVGKAYNKVVGENIPRPEVSSTYHDFCQWVCLALFVQGVLFYLPHSVWKCLEEGKMEQFCKNVISPSLVHVNLHMMNGAEEMSREDKMNAAANYLLQHRRLSNKFTTAYYFCENLTWLNIHIQTRVLDFFFQGDFLSFGNSAVAYFLRGDYWLDNPLSAVFPHIVKCPYNKIARSGLVNTVDVFCILPVNTLLENIYVLISFWYSLLFISSVADSVKNILTIAFPYVRGFRLSSLVTFNPYSTLATQVGSKCSFGDWFILNVLAKKMNTIDFKLLLFHLRQKMA